MEDEPISITTDTTPTPTFTLRKSSTSQFDESLSSEAEPSTSPLPSPPTNTTTTTTTEETIITTAHQRNNKPLFYQQIFLSSLSLIYFQAFLSYYLQYPGLNSTYGIEPVKRHVREVLSNTLFFPPQVVDLIGTEKEKIMDVDSFCEMVAFIGGLVSLVAASSLIQHGILFILLTILYYFLTTISGTFYSFQWDILLLETGFITALCYSPWLSLRLNYSNSNSSQQQNSISSPSTTLGTYPLRLLLFKLMFMSGVVKIQSSCPTWSNLTALEYHFATQCLPSPLSWHVHQLHPFILRLGVAVTFVVEIPGAFLLIAPWVVWRVIGGWLQILLQVLIILTGNYNFFNLLTILLCLPCFVDDYYGCEWNWNGNGKENETQNGDDKDGIDQVEIREKKQMLQWSKIQTIIKRSSCTIFLLWSSDSMLQFQYADNASTTNLWHTLNVKLTTTKSECDDIINQTVPYVVPLAMLLISVSAIYRLCLFLWEEKQQNSESNDSNKKQWMQHATKTVAILAFLLRLATCLLCMGVLSVPLITLAPELQSIEFAGYDFFLQSWTVARSYRISNGYGLFRRMTGVGRYRGTTNKNDALSFGWAGLPPSVVARPEVILEAVFDEVNDGGNTGNSTVVNADEWHELKFRWKPGDMKERPRQVAPHQPRLDWQMWFAALGQYQHNPWLIHLMDKILNECRPVLNLLDETDWFSKVGRMKQEKRIRQIRSKLFHYDFTRIDTEWSRGIPGVDLLGVEVGNGKQSAGRNHFFSWPDRYWSRSFQREYVPILNKDNPSVAQYLSAHGYERVECVDQWSHRCYGFEEGSSVRMICEVSSWIRTNYVLCNTIPLLLLILVAYARRRMAVNVKGAMRRGHDKSGVKLKTE